MAAIGRAQSAGASTGMTVALVVFVVLTVASLTGTIILYTYQSDLQASVDQAQQRSQRAEQQVRDARRQVSDFARIVMGVETDEIPAIQQAIGEAIDQLADDPRLDILPEPDEIALLTALDTLYGQFATTADVRARLEDEVATLRGQVAQRQAAIQAKITRYDEQIEQLEAEYQRIEAELTENRREWDDQVDTLSRQLETTADAAAQQLSQERQKRQAIADQLAKAEERRDDLVAQLARFKPQTGLTSALQIADGHVVRTVVGQDIAYISLGRRNQVKPRMSFAVYSQARGIPEDGQSKATLEVVEVFDNISECRVTSTVPGDPIVDGDIVANPVFDATRTYNFVVAGDFDLDYDGTIEDEKGIQVAHLIREAGGNLVNELTTETDFAVLGAAPPTVNEPGPDATPEQIELARQQRQRREAFDRIVSEAKALSIPVLNRTQFLAFMGLGKAGKTPPDGAI